MKINWRYIIFTLAIAFFLGLAYWNKAIFITYLIKPIASILWLVYRTLLSVNQEIYWSLLILITLILIILLIPDYHEYTYRKSYNNSVKVNDRVVYWDALLKSAEEGENGRLQLQHELESLNQSIEALLGGGDEIHLPTFKKDFRQRVQVTWMKYIIYRFNYHNKSHDVTDLEKSVDIIVKSMEDQLEINHDQESNRTNND